MGSSNVYEFTCANCGKTQILTFREGRCSKKFCNTECMKEYWEKKRQADADEAKAARAERTKQKRKIVPKSKCRQCKYSSLNRDDTICCYFELAGHSRLSLHPEGLNANCQEFAPRTKKRNKALSVK